MPGSRCLRILASFVALVHGAWGALAQPPAAGSEFQVNSFTSDHQRANAVAMRSDGELVVVWESSAGDGDSDGVFAQRFSKAGVAKGTELQVNSFTSGAQSSAAVAIADDGDFVVVWASYQQDGDELGLFAQRFDSAGVPQATEFRVNDHTLDSQTRVDIAMRGTGDFVVVWTSYGQDGGNGGIFGRRFDSMAAAQGAEFQVNAYTETRQFEPAIAMAGDGRFVVVWTSVYQDGDAFGVFGRLFTAGAVPLGIEFQVNSYITSYQFGPAVDLADDGRFVVVWGSYQDGSADGVFGQRFDAQAVPQGSEFQVNSYTNSYQEFPGVGVDDDGDFLVVWPSTGLDGSQRGVFGQHFSSAGAPQGPEVQINSYLTGEQSFPAVATAGQGAFVVVWRSYGQDGSGYGVFAQRFGTQLATIDVDGDGEVDPLTDALLMLRYAFGFRGATLITGAVDLANCSRCTAVAIEAYIDSLDG